MHLEELGRLRRNFAGDPCEQRTDPSEQRLDSPWSTYSSEAVIARGEPGPPEPSGPFERGRKVLVAYGFSDKRIVRAHFDPDVPLLDRRMLLEVKALRVLHYLSGVVVGAVRSTSTDDATVFGFRYDTLEGHIERGTEWFLLTKEHETGAVRFRIAACWQPGEFPNWWSRLGFHLVGQHYQRKWHRRAHVIMALAAQQPSPASPESAAPAFSSPDIIFERNSMRHA